MHSAPFPSNEAQRLEALKSLGLQDVPEERFDRVTRLAAEIFQVPMAFISFIERERQWFKSSVGLPVKETSRDVSFCAHAILGEGSLVVSDTKSDPRFSDNPHVTGDPFLRFYVGQPLRAPGGEKVGTLCIADRVPHEVSSEQLRVLPRLAALIEQELRMGELIDAQRELLAMQEELLKTQRRLQAELSEAAKYVRSLMPPPLRDPVAIDWRYVPSMELGGDGLGYDFLDESKIALYVLDVSGHGVGPALLSVVLLDLLRSRSLGGVDFSNPAEVLEALNREFPMQRHQRFFTIWYGVADLGRRLLTYSSAGHPPAALIRKSGEREMLSSGGVPAGCLPGPGYVNRQCELASGDRLYVYSDGTYETGKGRERRLTIEDLVSVLLESVSARNSLDRTLERLRQLKNVDNFTDDLSLLELQVP